MAGIAVFTMVFFLLAFFLLAFSLTGGLEAKEKSKTYLAEVESSEATTAASQGQDYGLNGASCRKKDTSFWGNDITSMFKNLQKTSDGCADMCEEMPACKAWTFMPGHGFFLGQCWLKDKVPTQEVTWMGFWSGVKDCATVAQTPPPPPPKDSGSICNEPFFLVKMRKCGLEYNCIVFGHCVPMMYLI